MDLLPLTAGVLMILISLYGIVVNLIVLSGMTRNKRFKSSFFLFCRSRTISNILTCLAFLCWSGPCTIVGYYYLSPPIVNVFWGQLAGWGAYVVGLMTDCAIAGNRFCATFYPFVFRNHDIKSGYITLVVCWMVATVYFAIGIPDGCGYIYMPSELSWSPANSSCAQNLADLMFYTVCTFTGLTFFLNMCTFTKLYLSARVMIQSTENHCQEKQAKKLFAQSVTQDCLYLVDMVSCQILYKLNSALWFQFICMSIVWLSVHILDGTVMLLYNRRYLFAKVKGNSSKIGWTSSPSKF